MQRGLRTIYCVSILLMALAAHAQTETFVGPTIPADANEVTIDDPSAAKNTSPAKAVEMLPLGQSRQGSFRDRLEAGGRLETKTSAGTPSLKVGEGWWRTAGALVIIIALILAVAAIVRKLVGNSGGLLHAMGAGGRAPSGLLHVLGRYPVGRGQTLILFKLDRRVILVCQSDGAKGGGMRTLCEINDPEEVASIVLHAAEAEGRTLSDRFREMVSGFESTHGDAESSVMQVEPPRGHTPEPMGLQDPISSLHTRLDSLRATERDISA